MKKSGIVLASLILISISMSMSYAQENYEIPSWIKELAESWVEDDISDQEFAQAISFLIKDDIINVPKITQLENENKNLINKINQLKSNLNIDLTYEIPVTLQVNKGQYFTGDEIITYGKVNGAIKNIPLIIQIKSRDGEMVEVQQINPNRDGWFATITKIGKSFEDKGTGMYTVTATHGSPDRTANIEFAYAGLYDSYVDLLTDKSEYLLGQIIKIKGKVYLDSQDFLIPVDIMIKDSNAEMIVFVQAKPTSKGIFHTEIDTSSDFSVGEYQMIAEYGFVQGKTSFEIID